MDGTNGITVPLNALEKEKLDYLEYSNIDSPKTPNSNWFYQVYDPFCCFCWEGGVQYPGELSLAFLFWLSKNNGAKTKKISKRK